VLSIVSLSVEHTHYLFFFQAEDGIRDFHVTGVQTCALPILSHSENAPIWNSIGLSWNSRLLHSERSPSLGMFSFLCCSRRLLVRSEERRVGKECRCRWSQYH